ncbi:PGAM Histidine phosphase domain containing protein [Pandoravirus dulcis]|uniref:PGAM Histidine phosphase domain containing protein n=1 Tax=Pandoravirus dulcis TaxID=1349409 RepID=S4VVY0_9VIRU|nr:PGAM Histidine phosphase domain containing protein [Pandoravirus dulcis]AGO82256.1 PGAM Histidine phosphase domain containing protein [Pandoravirus dulcis]
MPSSPSSPRASRTAPPPPPLLLYIRHGDDHHDARHEARYPKHDHPLNRQGKARAARMARNLVERYGAPTAVYCSPFKRARQTAGIMMDALDDGDRARVTIDPGLSRYFSRREQRRPSVGSDTHEAGPPPVRERNGEFGRRCRRQYERVVARHFFKADSDTAKRVRDGRPVVWCITHALVMRRVAERIGVVVPDDHVPFLGWFVARPRTSRPAMRGLSDHGLGHSCPERALAAARRVGGGHHHRRRRRKHDPKNDNDPDGGRDRKRGRGDRAAASDAKGRDRARNPKRHVADAKDHKQNKEARDRRRHTKRPRIRLCLEEKAKRRPRAPTTGA